MTTLMNDIDLGQLRELLTYNPESPILFSTGLFLWLFAIFMVVYAALQNKYTARVIFVTLFSYYFYYKSSGTYFFLLAIVTCADFFLARYMSKENVVWKRKALLATSVSLNLGLLCYFKYTNFFSGAFAALMSYEFTSWEIFLPVGISFFTFQSMSYTIDVYRHQLNPLKSLLDYAFYVSFFPQLVAGPIVRARDFIPQMHQPLVVTKELYGKGLFLIIGGLFKKCIISDYISVNFVDRIFDNPTFYSCAANLLGIYGYAMQIYCDFSGYSDMAIGIALLLGFRFNMNFNSPYKSASITEFWRRWHISLSNWLRDYLYISLGGNRHGKIRQYINLIITMFLGGLWHGASSNFIVWGLLHGTGLAAHKAWMTYTGKPKGYQPEGWRRIAGIFVTFNFVCLCWVFFRTPDFGQGVAMIGQVFSDFRPGVLPELLAGYKTVFMLIGVGYLLHWIPDKWEERTTNRVIELSFTWKAVILIVIIFLVVQMKSAEVQPFIYFQF